MKPNIIYSSSSGFFHSVYLFWDSSIMSLSTHSPSLFIAEQFSCIRICHNLFVCSPVDGYLGISLYFLAVTSKAAVKIYVQAFPRHVACISLEYIPRSRITMVGVTFKALRSCQTIFQRAVSFYIPTSWVAWSHNASEERNYPQVLGLAAPNPSLRPVLALWLDGGMPGIASGVSGRWVCVMAL